MSSSSGMASNPTRRVSYLSRSLSLVCKIPRSLLGLSETNTIGYYGQLDLFGEAIRMQKMSNLYECVDTLRAKYGKHTLFLGASFLAHLEAQHAGERGDEICTHLVLRDIGVDSRLAIQGDDIVVHEGTRTLPL